MGVIRTKYVERAIQVNTSYAFYCKSYVLDEVAVQRDKTFNIDYYIMFERVQVPQAISLSCYFNQQIQITALNKDIMRRSKKVRRIL